MILGVLDSACQVTGNQVIKSLIRVIFDFPQALSWGQDTDNLPNLISPGPVCFHQPLDWHSSPTGCLP